jgi:hypothetical protein
MSDHMKKVQSGDPLVVPAQAYNAFIDAAKDFQQRTAHIGQTATPGYRSASIVLVKNESGAARERFDVLGLGEPIILPDAGGAAEQQFKNAVAFRGELPDETLHKGKFVILAEPLATGAIGRAYLAGVTAVRLRLEDSAQKVEAAEIIDADATALQPAPAGSAAVLWHQEQTGDVWAVVRLGNVAPAGVWVQITYTEASGGEYSSWQEVELTADGEGGLSWTAKPDGLAGSDDGVIYEVNGVENIADETVVQVFPNPAYAPQSTDPLPAWLFQYEQPEVIGFGVPADGEVDVPHDADIDLTVTDAAGNPILDEQGQEQTIKVWRNALKRSLYTDFSAGTVFVYVKFPQPAPSGHGGCIFSRTEAFKNYREWLPPEGYSLYPNQQPPASTDITGEPGNEDHVHVIGKMFMETDADGKGWAPWFVIDPEALGSGKVKTDATDDTPGYLDDEIQVGENPGQPHTWVRKRVNDEPAGPEANDHKLRLYHGDWDALNTNKVGSLFSFGAAGANVAIVDVGVDPGPGTAWFTFSEYEDEYDGKKHSKVKLKVGARKLVINGLGKVFTDGNDTVPGFLDDEVIVLPPAGHNWITKTVTPGGVADNKLLIGHNDWDADNLQLSDPVPGNLVGGNGAEIVAEQPDNEPYVEYQEFRDRYDAKHHSLLTPQLAGEQPLKKYIKLPCKVKTDADDTTPGYLNDELIVDPVGGDPSWLEKTVTPGGAADNKLLIEHKDWDNDQTEHTVESLLSWEDHGGGVSIDISEPLPGWAWIQVETWRHKEDRKGHCDLIGRQPDPLPLDPIYLKWVAVPQGESTGDMLYWDGTKWVTLAAPSGGDFVLMSSGGAPYWQQVQEFECPGSGS